MKKNKLFWILTVVCVLNFAAHLYFYPSLPDIVPTHWGAGGQVNGWGPKSTVLILAALPFAMLILFEVIRKIDPKHQNFEKFGKVWNLCVVLFTVMMAAFSWLSELAVFGKLPDSSNLVSILVCGGIGVLFIILGNFMPQIKQGDILLLEDSLKSAQTVERDFAHLKLCGVFDRIGALVLGKHELFDSQGSGRRPLDILLEVVGEPTFPILAEFDCAHTHPMLTVPLGIEAELDLDAQSLTLCESWLGE